MKHRNGVPAPAIIGVVLFAALGGAVVQAGAISGTLDGVSTLTPTGTPGVFVQNFAGDGTDDTYGAFNASTESLIDFSSPPNITISGGHFQQIFPSGSLFGTSSGTGMGNGSGTATFEVDFVITGGTGIFAGDEGTATVTGTITMTGATTEAITASYVGSIAAVPEPSSLLLLAPALVGFMWRKKR